MGRQEYIEALKRALAGLPPDTVARTLAYYEQRFIDGLAAGRSESEISEDLGAPHNIATTLRSCLNRTDAETKPRTVGALRMAATATGLAVFNLFMVVPAAVFASLLAGIYAVSTALYFSGILVTASGLAGANEIEFSSPNVHYEDGQESRVTGVTRVTIGHHGVTIDRDRNRHADADNDAGAPSKVIRHEEIVAGRGIRVYTDLDTHSRTTQSLVGLAMVGGGVLVFLLSLVVSHYALVGLKRYIDMNLSLIRGG